MPETLRLRQMAELRKQLVGNLLGIWHSSQTRKGPM